MVSERRARAYEQAYHRAETHVLLRNTPVLQLEPSNTGTEQAYSQKC